MYWPRSRKIGLRLLSLHSIPRGMITWFLDYCIIGSVTQGRLGGSMVHGMETKCVFFFFCSFIYFYQKPLSYFGIFAFFFPPLKFPLGSSQCKHISELIFTHPPIYFASACRHGLNTRRPRQKEGGGGGRGDQTRGLSLTLIPVLASTFADPLLPGPSSPWKTWTNWHEGPEPNSRC